MARPTTRNTFSRDALDQGQRHTRNGRDDRSPQKKSKKPVKSNITKKSTTRPQSGPSAVDNSQSDDDEGDGSNPQEPFDPVEEPDVSTLSGAIHNGVGEDTPRLTGRNIKDQDMFQDLPVLDDMQSEVGAEIDISESEDYADVENVSDSGESDDEDDVLKSAEKDLIEEFERSEQRYTPDFVALDMNQMAIDEDDSFAQQLGLGRPLMQTVNDISLAVNMNEDPFHGLAEHDELYKDLWGEAESALWRMPETVRGRESNDLSHQKRVRFQERERSESSSSASEEQDPSEAFPDLFTASDDAIVKQRLALSQDQDFDFGNFNDDAESFYDFEDEDEKLAFEVDEESDSEFDTDNGDSDSEGDTTDDETREEQLARLAERKKAAGRAPNSVHPNTPVMAKRAISTNSTPTTSRPATPHTGRGPKVGTFAIDPTRPTMTTDSDGKKFKIIPPSQPREKERAFWERAKTANSSNSDTPPGSTYLTMPSPQAEDVPARPLTARSTLGSMFDGDVDILRNHDISGIAEDLFPAALSSRQTSFTATTTDDSEAEMQDINMQDFLAMDDSDDSESDVNGGSADQNVFVRRDSLPSGLLGHFEQRRGIVGSFRRNQHTARHFSSLASHPSERASTHEFNALQKGKRGAANTPITPARRKRISQDLSLNGSGVRKSMSNPLSTSRRQRSRGNSLAGINADLLQTLARNPFE